MDLSTKSKYIIAKSGKDGKWLPLWMHAQDTAGVMDYLLKNRYQSLGEMCGIDYDQIKKVALLLAYLHDIGKITPIFQSQILKSLPSRR